MTKTKVLITVKTYPAISKKYEELVCTAGFLEDGTWIRTYPIQFLGTTKQHHFTGKNPFLFIGTFHPKPILQYSLF